MTEPIRQALRAALKSNPRHLKAEAIARRMGEGVNVSTLYRWAEPGPEGDNIPLARLMQFVLITEDLRPLEALAGICGAAVLPMPRMQTADSAATRAHLTAITEFAEFIQTHGRAILDKRISKRELPGILKEGYEAMTAIAHLMELARILAEGPHA